VWDARKPLSRRLREQPILTAVVENKRKRVNAKKEAELTCKHPSFFSKIRYLLSDTLISLKLSHFLIII